MSTVEAYLPWLLQTFRPDLVLYDAGVDPHWEDELGRLRLTDQGHLLAFSLGISLPTCDLKSLNISLGLYRRDLFVMKTTVNQGVPIATVIGGGYSRDMDRLALRHSIVHRAATQVTGALQ